MCFEASPAERPIHHTAVLGDSEILFENCSNNRPIQIKIPLQNGEMLVLIDMLGAPKDIPLAEVNQNVYRLNQEGDVVWQIGKPDGIYLRTPYTNIHIESNERLKAYCWDGCEYEVDLTTGGIIGRMFLK